MIVMYKMTPEKKEKWVKKLDKMSEFIDEFRDCLEESEDFEGMYEEPDYRSNMRRMGGTSAMRSRYSRMG